MDFEPMSKDEFNLIKYRIEDLKVWIKIVSTRCPYESEFEHILRLEAQTLRDCLKDELRKRKESNKGKLKLVE